MWNNSHFIDLWKLVNDWNGLITIMNFNLDWSQSIFFSLKFTAVDQFQVENVTGKKVYIFDQLDTRIGNDAILKHLVKSKNENMILKLEFKENNASNEGNFTPKVLCIVFFIQILDQIYLVFGKSASSGHSVKNVIGYFVHASFFDYWFNFYRIFKNI